MVEELILKYPTESTYVSFIKKWEAMAHCPVPPPLHPGSGTGDHDPRLFSESLLPGIEPPFSKCDRHSLLLDIDIYVQPC